MLIVSHAGPVLNWLRELGRTVPGDVAMVELANYHPELGRAGMYYDAGKVGALAVEMLVWECCTEARRASRSDAHEVLLTGAWHDVARRFRR